LGQLDELGEEARRLPSGLKTRTAGCPEPDALTVPFDEGASKLPEGSDCLKMILTALIELVACAVSEKILSRVKKSAKKSVKIYTIPPLF
jgi:hypothetical protein